MRCATGDKFDFRSGCKSLTVLHSFTLRCRLMEFYPPGKYHNTTTYVCEYGMNSDETLQFLLFFLLFLRKHIQFQANSFPSHFPKAIIPCVGLSQGKQILWFPWIFETEGQVGVLGTHVTHWKHLLLSPPVFDIQIKNGRSAYTWFPMLIYKLFIRRSLIFCIFWAAK